MSKYNIVTTENINHLIKNSSKYYRTNLGQINTLENKSGDRKLNEKEPFVKVYLQNGGAFLYSKGNIGDIRIFVDYYIPENILLFFYENVKYQFQVDHEMISNQGSDFYLGHLIKKIETEIAERIAQMNEQKNALKEQEKKGNAEKIFTNPGEVNYEDVAAYLEKQRLERLSVKK